MSHTDLPTTHEDLPIVAVVFGPDEDGDFIAVKPGRRYEYLSGFAPTPEGAVQDLSEALDVVDETERTA